MAACDLRGVFILAGRAYGVSRHRAAMADETNCDVNGAEEGQNLPSKSTSEACGIQIEVVGDGAGDPGHASNGAGDVSRSGHFYCFR